MWDRLRERETERVITRLQTMDHLQYSVSGCRGALAVSAWCCMTQSWAPIGPLDSLQLPDWWTLGDKLFLLMYTVILGQTFKIIACIF